MALSTPSTLVGRVIGGRRYRLVSVIAHGGMGTVYQAEQLNMPRQVAIKVAHPEIASQPTFVQRFRQEIGAVARLEHGPSILPVYDFAEEDGLLYMVMPLVSGGTLKDRLQQAGGSPQNAQYALLISQQVLAALDYAHQRHFVHRDVKPSNILLEGDRAYLADFGIAKLREEGAAGAGLTLTGTALMGTPTYMAPEQALGQQVDHRADIYGYGVVLYEMLTGRVPYQAQTPMQVAFMHVEAALPPPRHMNPALLECLEAVLLRALARRPEDRFDTAAKFAAALATAVAEAEARGTSGPSVHPERLLADDDQPTTIHGANDGDHPDPTPPPLADAVVPDERALVAFQTELLRRLERARSVRGQQKSSPALTPAPAQRPAPPPTMRPAKAIAPGGATGPRPGQGTRGVKAIAASSVGSEPPAQQAPGQVSFVPLPVLPSGGGKDVPRQVAPGSKLGLPHALWRRHRRRAVPGLAAVGAVGAVTVASRAWVRPEPPVNGAASMDTSRTGHSAVPLSGGQLLVVGGQSDDKTYSASAERYDPAANRWSEAGHLAGPRGWHTATLLPNGHVLVVGGFTGSAYLPTAERYDPIANRWVPAGQMASPRGQHASALLPNGHVLVIGGIDGRTPLATSERYDPATDRWSSAGRLLAARQQGTATLLPNGEVLVAGGYDGSGSLAACERYDPNINRWVPAGELAKGRVWHTATPLANGHVLVTGGLNIASGQTTYLVEAERYDPAADAWAPAGELSNGRSAHTATALPNGSVLIAGGQSNSIWLAVAERYDPASGRWTPAGAMARARSQHQAALLTSGHLLVAGGIETANGKTTYLSAAERYDPVAQAWIDKRAL